MRERMMATIRHARSCDDRGAVAVEFALVLIPLLLVVYGIIDFGRAYNAQETLTQAARVGARLAALGKDQATVQTAVANAASSSITVSPSDVSVSGNCSGTDQSETVTVPYKFAYLTPLFPSSHTITITGTATAPC
jgi:Flp pilus assembly protein TadG